MDRTDLTHIENEWKEATQAGNDLYQQDIDRALLNYKTGLRKAEKLMENLEGCITLNIPIRPMFIVSCNNLAETHCFLEQWDKAEKMIQRGIFFIEFLRKKYPDLPTVKVFYKWLFKQLLLYKEFTVRSNRHEKYKAMIERLQQDESYFKSA